MKKLSIVFCLLCFVIFSSCDEINGPYEDYTNVPKGTRKVLLEDFTGHQCGNCPTAAREALKLDSIFEGRIILVGTHVSFFADTNKTGKFTYNFKTEAGNQLDVDYGIEAAGLPKGMVNRAKYNTQYLLNYGDWASVIAQQLAVVPDVHLAIENTYNETTRELNIDVDVEYMKRGRPNQRMVVYLLEDSIVNWQKDYALPDGQQDVSNYVHRHVLRKAITPTYGDVITNTESFIGKVTRKTFTTTLSPAYNDKHCSIVVFVLDDKGPSTTPKGFDRVVLQAEEKKVIE
jgi:hypothetical protein